MPGLKRPTGSQKFSKAKRTARPKRKSGAQLGSGLQRQELKVFDTALSFTFDATGEVPASGQLSLIQTGDTLNNRDGAVIMVKSLTIRGSLALVPAAAATASGIVYLYVVQDKQCNGAAAAVTDVLTSTDLKSALGNVPNQFRFRIVRKFAVEMNSEAGVTTAYNNYTKHFEEYIEFKKPLEIRYTASAGAITDLASNNLFLIAGSTGTIDDLVTMTGVARLRFTG